MSNPALDQMRVQLQSELTKTENELEQLREQKQRIASVIRDKVAEQQELKSAIARLTPRAPRGSKKAVEAAKDDE